MKHLSLLLFLFIAGSHLAIAQTPNCGVSDKNLPDSIIRLMRQAPQLLANQRARRAAAPRNICRVAVEIDSDTYLEFDKDTSQIRAQVLKEIDAVSQVYERDINTQLVVVRIHIWKDTESDPYRGETNIFTLLNKFQNLWDKSFKEIPYDKVMYLFTKSVTGGAIGVGGGTYLIARINGVIAHELGHCFSSPHTHNCSWPGGPIDYCAAVEGGDCYSGSLEYTQGMLMSYCESQYRFHPLCQAVMTDHAEKTMPKITSAPDKVPILPVQLTLSASRYLYWDGQPLAERYDIEISETADFTTKLVSDTAAVNGYDLSKLKTGRAYFVRVRSVNRLGASAWSAISQLQLTEATIPAPVLLLPTQNQVFVPYNDGNRSFLIESTPGATAYEIHITYGSDENFSRPSLYKNTYTSASFSVQYTNTGPLLWRVRTLFGSKTGPWSSTGRFFVNPPASYLQLPFTERALSFPYSYHPTNYDLPITVVVATDSLFTQPVYQKVVRSNRINGGGIIGMLEDLRPNTHYYMKVEETNDGQKANYPTGALTSLKRTFRTGLTPLPSQWSFINSDNYPDLPQGSPATIIPTKDALWISYYEDGLFRINPDSLTSQTFNRTTTNGKIGGLYLSIEEGKPGEVWVSNAISQSRDAARQVGKLSGTSGALTERTVVKPGNVNYKSFNVNPQLFYADNAIYAPEGESLTKIYQAPDNQTIYGQLTRPGVVWMIQSNRTISVDEIVEFNLLTKTTRIFSSTNTPQLGRYLSDISTDALGNIWISQSNGTSSFPALAKFDGQNWTAYKWPEIPIYYVNELTNDPLGNLYAVANINPQVVYRYDGKTWQNVVEIPSNSNSYIGNMKVDGRGNIWFSSYQVIRYNRCATVAAPKLSATKQTTDVGESVTLRAEGCSSAVWSWSSAGESVTDQLVRGSNELVVKPNSNTTYRARCYDDGCSGSEAKLSVAVSPRLSITKTSKTTYCPGDELTASFSLQGGVEQANKYSLVLKSGTQSTRFPAAQNSAGLITTLQGATPGRYVVYAESSLPAVRSRDSVNIVIAPFPTAELSSSKPALMPGDSARISVALTGTPPWQFTRWDQQPVQTAVSPYVASFKAGQQLTYKLTISALTDSFCPAGVVKNELTINLIPLASEPATELGLSVYPNPTSGKLIIEATAPVLINSLQLRNMQGQEVKQKLLPVAARHTEWDIADAPAGAYLLHIKITDGKEVVWKLVKL